MHSKSSKQCTGQLLTEKNYSYPNASRAKTRNPALLDQGHEKNGISCSSLWNVNGFLSQCLLPTHTKKHLACLWSQAGTTQIELVGGTESNTILCCCIHLSLWRSKCFSERVIPPGKGTGSRSEPHFTDEKTGGLERLSFAQGYSVNQVQRSGN